MKSLAILCLCTATASAEGEHTAVSFDLATAAADALAIQVERDLGHGDFSIVGVVGARSAAHGDYSSVSAGAGIEVRKWIRQPMSGPYVGGRLSLATTHMRDAMEDRALGALTTWTLAASVGYRWVVLHTVELTPSLGYGIIVEGGAMSPATARGAVVFGLTTGVIF